MRINTGELGWWLDLKEVFQTLEMWSKLISRRRDSSRSFDGDSFDARSQRHKHTLCRRTEHHNLHTRKPSSSSERSEGLAETIGIFHDSPACEDEAFGGGGTNGSEPAGSETMTRWNVASEPPAGTYAWSDPRPYTHGLTREKAIVSVPNLFLCTTQWVKYGEMKRWYLVFQNISALHGAV